ncbi:MAG: mitochondrial fission ELM1 family protein, partial [Candidatus Omnitrophica bacterium]|nr:mitochondrial fission ELM1 family protein [Candidatus Omnitrophota bacterium]
MKKRFLEDYILYAIAKSFSLFLSIVPVGAALVIGRVFGRIAYYVNVKRSKVAYANMRSAFSAHKEPSQIRRMVKDVYINFGQVLVEVLRIPVVDKRYIEKYVKVENRKYIDEVLSHNKGLIFLTGHYGNWEMLSITSALKGYPLLVLAREQKMKRLNDTLNSFRESKGCKVVNKGMATRGIYDHLNKGGILGILSDQDAGKKASFVEFFGRPTSTPKGAFALSRKTKASIIPAFMIREKGPYHRLLLERPIEPPVDEVGERKAMQHFASLLEKNISEHPPQWLWLHKRWKSTPLRTVVILSDGKKGHVNQSIAVYNKIKKCRSLCGYGDKDTKLTVIEVGHKTAIRRVWLSLASRAVAGCGILRNQLLKSCLSSVTYADLKKKYADIVISCGATTEAVNLLFSRENNARSVVIMKPSTVQSKLFDLAIIPEHDNPPARNNVVATNGTVSFITPERLQDDFRSLRQHVEFSDRPNIGLLIGGDNRDYTLDSALIKAVLEGVRSAAFE